MLTVNYYTVDDSTRLRCSYCDNYRKCLTSMASWVSRRRWSHLPIKSYKLFLFNKWRKDHPPSSYSAWKENAAAAVEKTSRYHCWIDCFRWCNFRWRVAWWCISDDERVYQRYLFYLWRGNFSAFVLGVNLCVGILWSSSGAYTCLGIRHMNFCEILDALNSLHRGH